MKKPRKYHLPPPKNAAYHSGGIIELSAADDLINAGKPLPPTVELTPVGPPLLVLEFRAEDDLLAAPTITASAEAAAKKKATRELASELAVLLAASENPRQALREVIDQITREIESVAGPAAEPLKE
jgi:hypothetical protein